MVMIREEEDVQLDNVARTVIANNTADIHISLHLSLIHISEPTRH